MGEARRSGFERCASRGFVVGVLAAALFLLCAAPAASQDESEPAAADTMAAPVLLPAPTGVTVEDTPSDRGGSVNVTWEIPEGEGAERITRYFVERSDAPDGEFAQVGRTGRTMSSYRDGTAPDGEPAYYRVVATDGTARAASEVRGPVIARPQWFNRNRLNVMIWAIGFVSAIVYFVRAARKGKDLFIRRMAGLDEMDNAVGRATEMGKPILYISGLSTVSDVATIAAINILGEVAKKTAEYNTRLIVPCADPIVMAVEQEVVKEAYAEVGRPDAYNEDDVFYLTRSQFAYVAGVNGIMVRQRPATILYMGMFYAESLVLAETGSSVGSIQIAGTDAVTQLPFFITSCDYTLIGEELYAASAYLSREPVLLGGLKGQDAAKMAVGLIMIIAVITATLTALNVLSFDFMLPVLRVG
jgi:hypothetical protein